MRAESAPGSSNGERSKPQIRHGATEGSSIGRDQLAALATRPHGLQLLASLPPHTARIERAAYLLAIALEIGYLRHCIALASRTNRIALTVPMDCTCLMFM